MDVEGKAALEDMRDALSGFVYAPMPAEGFRSLATYERARGELGAADATLLQSIGIERRLLLVRRRAPFCLSRSRACRTPRFTS